MTGLHLFFLFIAIPAILYADAQAFGWVRGKRDTIDPKLMQWLHWVVYGALAGLIGTGILLFIPRSSWLVNDPTFLVKMGFVAVLVINSFFIGSHMDKAVTQPFRTLAKSEQRWILISGAVSTICWLGAIAGGLLIG